MTTLREVGILGTGSYVPDRVLTNADFERMVDTSDEWITTRTGIKERRIAAPDQATSDLAYEAAKRALDDAKLDPKEIDMIVVATVTPDHLVPSTACIIQHRLGCVNASAFDMEVACSGFVAALCTARAMISSRFVNKVLVVGAETMTRIVNYEDRGSCIIFGDAAGAAVISADAPRGRILDGYMGADGSGAFFMVVPAVGSRKPASVEAVQNKEHLLFMRGGETFKFAVQKFRDLVADQCSRLKIAPSEIALVVPHQVNMRIIESALKKLDI
jgi:3-oxoacyl-[acyl-carrier-protein] synthase III